MTGTQAQAKPKKSGLAIASLALGIIGFCSVGLAGMVGLIASLVPGIIGLCFAGLISIIGMFLGVVSLVKIKKSQGQLSGQGVAISGIAAGSFSLVFWLLVSAIVVPNLLHFEAKSKNSETRTNLTAIKFSKMAFLAEYNRQPQKFNEISWKPNGKNRYAYFLTPEESIQPESENFQLSEELAAGLESGDYQALAVGNIDRDETLDVWAIDREGNIINLINDLNE